MTEERRPSPAPARARVPLRTTETSQPARSRIRPFITTPPSPCPYLPGRTEQKLVTSIEADDPEVYNQLHDAGFRRSHEMAYRPVCADCNQCKSLRIKVDDFAPNRTQRKLLKRHSLLRRSVAENGATQESFALFQDYTKHRHSDGEMSSMGPSDFASLIHETSVDTHVIEWHDHQALTGESLRAACITDVLHDGLSMVYSYFDVAHPSNSYGTFMILSLMDVCRRLELPYLYLGYWVEGSASMDYKAAFHPAEVYGPNGWQPLKSC